MVVRNEKVMRPNSGLITLARKRERSNDMSCALASVCPERGRAYSLLAILSHRKYSMIIFRKSTPPQNRQLIVHCSYLKYQVDDSVGELTLEN